MHICAEICLPELTCDNLAALRVCSCPDTLKVTDLLVCTVNSNHAKMCYFIYLLLMGFEFSLPSVVGKALDGKLGVAGERRGRRCTARECLSRHGTSVQLVRYEPAERRRHGQEPNGPAEATRKSTSHHVYCSPRPPLT